jgi:hypothetical protein
MKKQQDLRNCHMRAHTHDLVSLVLTKRLFTASCAIQPKNYLATKFPEVQHSWDAYGIMETLVVDNGKEFYSQHFQVPANN